MDNVKKLADEFERMSKWKEDTMKDHMYSMDDATASGERIGEAEQDLLKCRDFQVDQLKERLQESEKSKEKLYDMNKLLQDTITNLENEIESIKNSELNCHNDLGALRGQFDTVKLSHLPNIITF